MTDPREIRERPRKQLRCNARVALENKSVLPGRTVDISSGGVSIMLQDSLAVGSPCLVGLEPVINGNVKRMVLKAKVAYCSCIGTQGFRIGFQFLQIDAENAHILGILTK